MLLQRCNIVTISLLSKRLFKDLKRLFNYLKRLFKDIPFDSDVKVKKVTCVPLCSTFRSPSWVYIFLKDLKDSLPLLMPRGHQQIFLFHGIYTLLVIQEKLSFQHTSIQRNKETDLPK